MSIDCKQLCEFRTYFILKPLNLFHAKEEHTFSDEILHLIIVTKWKGKLVQIVIDPFLMFWRNEKKIIEEFILCPDVNCIRFTIARVSDSRVENSKLVYKRQTRPKTNTSICQINTATNHNQCVMRRRMRLIHCILNVCDKISTCFW